MRQALPKLAASACPARAEVPEANLLSMLSYWPVTFLLSIVQRFRTSLT